MDCKASDWFLYGIAETGYLAYVGYKNDLFKGFVSGTNVLQRYHVNEGLIVSVGIEKKVDFDRSKLKVSCRYLFKNQTAPDEAKMNP